MEGPTATAPSSSSEQISCTPCNKTFACKEDLREHGWEFLHHIKLESKQNNLDGVGKKHECDLCDFQVDNLADFRKHTESETHVRKFNIWREMRRAKQDMQDVPYRLPTVRLGLHTNPRVLGAHGFDSQPRFQWLRPGFPPYQPRPAPLLSMRLPTPHPLAYKPYYDPILRFQEPRTSSQMQHYKSGKKKKKLSDLVKKPETHSAAAQKERHGSNPKSKNKKGKKRKETSSNSGQKPEKQLKPAEEAATPARSAEPELREADSTTPKSPPHPKPLGLTEKKNRWEKLSRKTNPHAKTQRMMKERLQKYRLVQAENQKQKAMELEAQLGDLCKEALFQEVRDMEVKVSESGQKHQDEVQKPEESVQKIKEEEVEQTGPELAIECSETPIKVEQAPSLEEFEGIPASFVMEGQPQGNLQPLIPEPEAVQVKQEPMDEVVPLEMRAPEQPVACQSNVPDLTNQENLQLLWSLCEREQELSLKASEADAEIDRLQQEMTQMMQKKTEMMTELRFLQAKKSQLLQGERMEDVPGLLPKFVSMAGSQAEGERSDSGIQMTYLGVLPSDPKLTNQIRKMVERQQADESSGGKNSKVGRKK